MTEHLKNMVREKLFAWVRSKGCAVEFSRCGDSYAGMKALEIMQLKNGNPWCTICYEPFDNSVNDSECLKLAVDRLVENKLTFGFFDRLGLKDVDSYEELELKLSVLGAD